MKHMILGLSLLSLTSVAFATVSDKTPAAGYFQLAAENGATTDQPQDQATVASGEAQDAESNEQASSDPAPDQQGSDSD